MIYGFHYANNRLTEHSAPKGRRLLQTKVLTARITESHTADISYAGVDFFTEIAVNATKCNLQC